MKKVFNLQTAILLCLTLGLAPYFPEPHIWGKLKWVAGGAVGMQTMDWLDLIMHGIPWIILIVVLIQKIAVRQTAE